MKLSNNKFNQSIDGFYQVLLAGFNVNHNGTVEIVNSYIKNDYIFIKLKIDQLVIDFTVGYHDVYQAPVVYFRVYHDTKPVLVWDQLVSHCCWLSIDSNIPINIDSHHILHDSWWMIHPCETRQYMDQFNVNTPLDYMSLWWSIYGLSGLFRNITLRKWNGDNDKLDLGSKTTVEANPVKFN